MQFDFDLAKDVLNYEKHGLSLAMANELDWEAALVRVDERFEYGESRMIALAPQSAILYYVALWTAAACEESSACAAPTVER